MVWYSSIIPMAASPLISGTTTTGRYHVFTPHERSSCRPFVKSCNWRSGSMPSVGSPPSVQRDASPFDAPNVAGTANCFRQRWKNILRYSAIARSRRWQPQRSIPTWSFKSHVHNNYPNPCSKSAIRSSVFSNPMCNVRSDAHVCPPLCYTRRPVLLVCALINRCQVYVHRLRHNEDLWLEARIGLRC